MKLLSRLYRCFVCGSEDIEQVPPYGIKCRKCGWFNP